MFAELETGLGILEYSDFGLDLSNCLEVYYND